MLVTPMSLSVVLPSANQEDKETGVRMIDGIPVEEFHDRLLAVAEKVDEYVEVSLHVTGAASVRETQLVLDGWKYVMGKKEKKLLEEWEDYTNGFMQKQRDSAIQMYSKMMTALLVEEDKSISRRTIDDIRAKFMDRSVDYKPKEKYVLDTLPKRIAEWKKVAEERAALLKNPKVSRLTNDDVPGINLFLDKDAFLEMKYPERRNLVDTITALLASGTNKLDTLYKDVKKELLSYVSDGRMHRSKVGVWLRRMFESSTTTGEVNAFRTSILREYAENWLQARKEFNKLNKDMNLGGVPHGLDKWSLDRFLLADYAQRMAYLDEVKARMTDDVNEDGDLPRLRLDIRHAMDTNDWDYAEELLQKAKAINADGPSLRTIERFLRVHQSEDTDGDSEAEGMKAMLQLQSIMEQLPANMRWMTEEALGHSNPNVLKRLWQIFYNRHWVITHGYSNPNMDQEHSFNEEHQDATAERIANGHKSELERNIMKDETATKAAMRGDCTKPQVIYTDKSGMHEVFRGVVQYADDSKMGYWTSLIDDDVTYGQLREAVLNHMYLIKKNASIIRKAGLMYTSHGVPFSAN